MLFYPNTNLHARVRECLQNETKIILTKEDKSLNLLLEEIIENFVKKYSKKMAESQTISAPFLEVNLTPLAFRLYAKDYYDAYKSYIPEQSFSRAKYFLLCISIELAAKTLHVDQGKDHKDLLKIGHNLKRACKKNILEIYNLSLNSKEIDELTKANTYYSTKGFEYFIFKHPEIDDPNRAGGQLAMEGYPDLPNLDILEGILTKLLSADLQTELVSES